VLSKETLNPADEAELRADTLVDALPATTKAGAMERVEWWLDEDGDECVFLSLHRLPHIDGMETVQRICIESGRRPPGHPYLFRPASTVQCFGLVKGG
jgi:hypothetical protein